VHAYERLRAIRAFEREHLRVLQTVEDFNVVLEIAYHEALGRPLNLKQLVLLDTGSMTTVQRRLRRLKREGVIEQHKSRTDRRALEFRLSPRFRRLYAEYGALIGSEAPSARRGATHRVRPRAAAAGVYVKTLRRAALVLGGPAVLSHRLGVSEAALEAWLKGEELPPMDVFLACVEIMLLAVEKPEGRA